MRKIKFRAWYKPKKQMMNPDYLGCNGNCYDWSIEPGDGLENESDFYILMQYTGLKDKNGKEIYEGDLLNISITDDVYLFMEVFFIDGEFVLVYPDNGTYFAQAKLARSYEVIGNIYENPELLEAK